MYTYSVVWYLWSPGYSNYLTYLGFFPNFLNQISFWRSGPEMLWGWVSSPVQFREGLNQVQLCSICPNHDFCFEWWLQMQGDLCDCVCVCIFSLVLRCFVYLCLIVVRPNHRCPDLFVSRLLGWSSQNLLDLLIRCLSCSLLVLIFYSKAIMKRQAVLFVLDSVDASDSPRFSTAVIDLSLKSRPCLCFRSFVEQSN